MGRDGGMRFPAAAVRSEQRREWSGGEVGRKGERWVLRRRSDTVRRRRTQRPGRRDCGDGLRRGQAVTVPGKRWREVSGGEGGKGKCGGWAAAKGGALDQRQVARHWQTEWGKGRQRRRWQRARTHRLQWPQAATVHGEQWRERSTGAGAKGGREVGRRSVATAQDRWRGGFGRDGKSRGGGGCGNNPWR
eukprot:scaffold23588_cov25-Tisochrysis_lutea.AAC.2